MSDYEARRAAERAKEAADMDRFEAVLSAGSDAGLWRVVPIKPRADDDEMAQQWRRTNRQVETDAGRFDMHLGRDGTAGARVSQAGTDHGIRVLTSDLRPAAVAPTASASLTRDSLTVARDLHRRVCVPGAEVARRLGTLLAERIAQREQLLQHVKALKAQGVTFGDQFRDGGPDDSTYYEAKGWASGDVGSVRVTATGRVYVERVTVTVADLPALRAMTARAK